MRQLRLVTRLKLIVGGLSTLVTMFSILALSGLVYISAEVSIKSRLIAQSTTLLEENIKFVDGHVAIQDSPDGTSLATRLREYNVSLYLYDNKQASFAQYGFYRDLDTDSIKLLLPDEQIEQLGQLTRGVYSDITVPKFGLYDTYTIPLRSENESLGYLQLASQNTVWEILINSIFWSFLILLPIIWVVSYFAATSSSAIALAPLMELVSHLNKLDPEHLPKEIKIGSRLDSDVFVLTKAFNLLLARISDTLAKQREVVENISHELKTPLTRISSSLDVLSTEASERQKPMIDKIRHETISLGGNVDAILSMVAESPTNKTQTFLLSPIIVELVRVLPSSQKVNIALPPRFAVCFDPAVLRIILRNLIDNAIKYGQNGREIVIAASGNQSEWQIVISNWAKSENLLNKNIFLRKVRGEGRAKGYGIGLDLVRELCKQHHVELLMTQSLDGKVTVEISSKC